jgi:uncharacterized protein
VADHFIPADGRSKTADGGARLLNPSPFSAGPDGLRVRVRLTPKASRDKIDGVVLDADGKAAVKASVTAVPEDGKANAALIKMLAKEWRIPKSAMDVVQGATDRRKTILISGDLLSGDGAEWAARLDQWMVKRS